MKKDINFLESRKLVSGKKSTNTVGILAVVMVIVIAVVGIMFAKTKMQIKDYNDQIVKLEQDKNNSKYAIRRAQYKKVKDQLESYLLETMSKDVVIKDVKELEVLSEEIFNAIFDATGYGTSDAITLTDFNFITGNEHNIRISGIAYGDNENAGNVLKARERGKIFAEKLDKIKTKDGKLIASSVNLSFGEEDSRGQDNNGNIVGSVPINVFIVLNSLVEGEVK